MSWKEAEISLAKSETKKSSKQNDASAKLAAALQNMAIQPEGDIVDGKRFYTSRMRCRAALQNCDVSELDRILEVASDMRNKICEAKFLNKV